MGILDDAIDRIAKDYADSVAKAREEGIRDALIAMGWMPPENTRLVQEELIELRNQLSEEQDRNAALVREVTRLELETSEDLKQKNSFLDQQVGAYERFREALMAMATVSTDGVGWALPRASLECAVRNLDHNLNHARRCHDF